MCACTFIRLWNNPNRKWILSWSVELFADFRICIKNLAILLRILLRADGSKHTIIRIEHFNIVHKFIGIVCSRDLLTHTHCIRLRYRWLNSDKRFQDENYFIVTTVLACYAAESVMRALPWILKMNWSEIKIHSSTSNLNDSDVCLFALN